MLKVLFIPRIGEPYLMDVRDENQDRLISVIRPRGSHGEAVAVVFRWHGHVVRRDGSHLLDVYEEA